MKYSLIEWTNSSFEEKNAVCHFKDISFVWKTDDIYSRAREVKNSVGVNIVISRKHKIDQGT